MPKPVEVGVSGVALGYFETGTEGMVWTVFTDEPLPGRSTDAPDFYRRLLVVDPGDHMRITSPAGDIVLFDGVIEPDSKIGWTEYPRNPGHGQPVAFGCWIHWTQTGWDAETWAALFLWQLPAILTKGLVEVADGQEAKNTWNVKARKMPNNSERA